MNAKNSDRYRRMLLAKKRELSISSTGAESPLPSAGGWQGDLVDQANADTEADLQISCIKPTYGSYERSRTRSLGSITAPMVYVPSANRQSPRRVSTRCRGHISVGSASSGSTVSAP